MSFSDQAGLGLARKAGCALYFFVSAFVLLIVFGYVFFGHCAVNCENQTLTKTVVLWATIIGIPLGGFFLIRSFMRDEN